MTDTWTNRIIVALQGAQREINALLDNIKHDTHTDPHPYKPPVGSCATCTRPMSDPIHADLTPPWVGKCTCAPVPGAPGLLAVDQACPTHGGRAHVPGVPVDDSFDTETPR